MTIPLVNEFKLYETVFIETNVQSSDYDGVVLILLPKEKNVYIPRHIVSYVDNLLKVDKQIYNTPSVWNCDYVSGARLILSPTGDITPYHDVNVVNEAAKRGILRALEAGVKKPLLVVQNLLEYPDSQLVTILGALEALYVPLQIRELKPDKANKIFRLGLHADEKLTESFERIVRNALALERSRIFTRDIAGGDPERMSPIKIEEYIKQVLHGSYNNISIKIINNDKEIADDYPLLAAVSRASVERHKSRIIELTYKPSDLSRVTETLILIGKGVTYDTGGADIKINGKMVSMSRDKCGAAAVAGFVKACSILKPTHLKVVGVLCLCRNSVGENSYVSDELLLSKSGKTVRIGNTDAEGRLAMADSLYKWSKLADNEMNPHIYTIATLTGHAKFSYRFCTASMDNHLAKATNHSIRLQYSGGRVGESIEVSTIRFEDLEANQGQSEGDEILQHNAKIEGRGHQIAGGFLLKVSGLDEKNVKYTHLDIAGSCGMLPSQPTAVPLLSLCHMHKVIE